MNLSKTRGKILLLIFLVLSGCSARKYNQMEIKGDGKDCFTKANISTLVNNSFGPDDGLTKFLYIRKNVTDTTSCIGLYNCVFIGLSSNEIVRKVLKFEDKIYNFSDKNESNNELALQEFISLYKGKFIKEKMDELIFQFQKGTEY
ncbi:hypothetical protein [Flavobacterium sp. C4GT6]|uniref:hypothetical protein n=1 Tax=Flavobacterium sp. C4GT6 TaxID=3103818 RepID=UPI002ED5623A